MHKSQLKQSGPEAFRVSESEASLVQFVASYLVLPVSLPQSLFLICRIYTDSEFVNLEKASVLLQI